MPLSSLRNIVNSFVIFIGSILAAHIRFKSVSNFSLDYLT